MNFDPLNLTPPGAKIKVIGVGGGGGNAVNTMIRSALDGVDFIAANTDVQALRFSLAPHKVQIGKELTRGLGAGADPDIGRDAAIEDRSELETLLAGADMVFITAGMGGGTGTGGAAIIAQIARELGALTVAVVTKPFMFEGKRRKKHAELGITRLRECVDTLITIPNQRLLQVASPTLSMVDAFKMADDVLVNAVRGISDIINVRGELNVDFADVRAVMSNTGQALMGIGVASGESRAREAARMAISSPLLEDINIEGATGILINITASGSIGMLEIDEACSPVRDAAHEDANIIFGVVIDESMGDSIRVTVIATGFPVEKDDGDILTPRSASRQNVPAAESPRASDPGITASPVRPGANPPRATSPFHPPHGMTLKTAEATPSAPKSIVMAESTATQVLTEAQVLAKLTLDGPAAETDFAIHSLPDSSEPADPEGKSSALAGATAIPDPSSDEPTPGHITNNDLPATTGTWSDIGDLYSSASSEVFAGTAAPAESINCDLAPWNAGDVWGDKAEHQVELGGAGQDFAAVAVETSTTGATGEGEPKPRVGAFAAERDADLSSPFTSATGTYLAGDIDRRIDEAMEIAARVKTPSIDLGSTDDLDVPAFLRATMKDIPLG